MYLIAIMELQSHKLHNKGQVQGHNIIIKDYWNYLKHI